MKKIFKVVVSVPVEDADNLRQVIGDAGGGRVGGHYSHCSFSIKGTGRFLPEYGANPHIGQVGKPQEVAEERIEFGCDESMIEGVIAAIRSAHPYEEPVIDIYPAFAA